MIAVLLLSIDNDLLVSNTLCGWPEHNPNSNANINKLYRRVETVACTLVKAAGSKVVVGGYADRPP